MNEQTPTPRTDAEWERLLNATCLPGCNSQGHEEKCPYCNPEVCLADFARQLERELVEARKDKERLKWMVEHEAHVSFSNDGECCNVWLNADRDGNESCPVEGYPQISYSTWQQAIDAAILTEKKGQG